MNGDSHPPDSPLPDEPPTDCDLSPDLGDPPAPDEADEAFSCPIAEDRDRVNQLSEEMIETFARIRTNLEHCPDCPHYQCCPVLAGLNTQIHTALHEVLEELAISY